jgi:hypothetical protein
VTTRSISYPWDACKGAARADASDQPAGAEQANREATAPLAAASNTVESIASPSGTAS